MYTRRTASPITKARRIVVKVGSALLVDGATGRLNRAWLETLTEDLVWLRKRGQEVILVSSGAIALGRRHLGLAPGALRLEESQAAAAVGQIRLAHAYKELFEAHGVTVAQVLLTLEDSERRRRYLNARATLHGLLSLGALPVINENDTVATAEIRYGDNDRLAARVAQMASADCVLLLSDVDGLYTADPSRNEDATFIERVQRVTPEIEAMAGAAVSDVGSGGMATKIAAAKIALSAGAHPCIAAGAHKHPVRRIEALEVVRHGEHVVIEVRANGFLYHMVRNIVGSLVRAGSGEAEPGWLGELLALRDRRVAAPTAPSAGLFLAAVHYPEVFGLPVPSSRLVSSAEWRDR